MQVCSTKMSAHVILTEKSELGPLISPQRNQRVPIHKWFPYKHGFSRDLATYLIRHCNVREGEWVLDPFCGGGTTLLACKEAGINAQGYDILPFPVFVSNVKLGDYEPAEIQSALDAFKYGNNKTRPAMNLPDIPLVKRAFAPDVREALLSLKSRIESVSNPKVRSFFNLGFLSIVESVSNTTKAGGFLRFVTREVNPSLIEKLLLDKLDSMLSDVVESSRITNDDGKTTFAQIGDARRLPTNQVFDAVITSPPYPNRHDYTRIYELEMIFDFVASNEELKKLRYETIRSHVEARKRYEAVGYERLPIVDDLVKEIRHNGTNNPQVIGMIEGYFEDMYLALLEISRCLKNRGKAALVVSNVRFAGVNVPVDEILAETGSQVGLKIENICILRYRGNSSQQMRSYRRSPSRESIIMWEKNA